MKANIIFHHQGDRFIVVNQDGEDIFAGTFITCNAWCNTEGTFWFFAPPPHRWDRPRKEVIYTSITTIRKPIAQFITENTPTEEELAYGPWDDERREEVAP